MADATESKRITAGVLALLVGWTGAHKFYLGNTTTGILQIFASICSCGAINLIEGIIYLTKSDADFIATYQVGKKQWL